MTVTVEQLPGEPIFIATFGHPLDPSQDVRTMFKAFIPMRAGIKASVALILDLSAVDDSHTFSQVVFGLGEAAAQVRANKTDKSMSAPQIIFVGTGDMVALAADAMGQTQYSGNKATVCTLRDEAIALAQNLSSVDRNEVEG